MARTRGRRSSPTAVIFSTACTTVGSTSDRWIPPIGNCSSRVDASNVVVTQGRLLFLRETTLMAQPFDARALALTGEPVPLAEQIQTVGGPPLGIFSASDNGVLVYQTGTAGGMPQLTWFDRSGKPVGVIGDRGNYGDIELSPDRKAATVSLIEGGQSHDIWIVDLARGVRSRFTFDPAPDETAIWSPDGSRLVFNSFRKGRSDLYQKSYSGASTEEVLLADDHNKSPQSWSPDGRFMLYTTTGGGPSAIDLWVLPLTGDRKSFPFLNTQFTEGQGQFSPDGRWIAYVSNESGHAEVYVAAFPGPRGKRQISIAGGDSPRWRRDGKELFYRTIVDGKLMAAAVDGRGAAFEVGAVTPLFSVLSGGPRHFYDVSEDGRRLLISAMVVERGTSVQPITVVVNWAASLGK